MNTIRLAASAVIAAGVFFASVASAVVDAARLQDEAAVLAMIASGADVNERSPDGTSALHWAVYNGNSSLVDALLKAGADPSAVNDYGSTPLSEAAITGNAAVIESLLEAGADPDSANADGQTALMVIARSSNVDAARVLIEHGADVNATEQWRYQTAVMWAAAQNQPEMVALLLEHGADPNAKTVVNHWARQVSAEARRAYRPTGGLTPLLFAAREGCAGCAKSLIEAGADIELSDPDGITPLFLAIDNLHYDTAKVLIEAGANPNRWDRWGRSPLYGAVDTSTVPAGGRPDRASLDETTALDIIEMLLDAGANPNLQIKGTMPYRSIVDDRGCDRMLNQPGPTALLRAAKAFDAPAMKLLIEHGAMIELPNRAGITPIMAAAGLGSVECDSRGPSDRIPQYLEDDVQQKSIAALKVLIEAGADINAHTALGRGGRRGGSGGQTALHGAAFWGWNDVVAYLVEHGAQIDAADELGRTPLDSAMGRAGGNGRGGRIDVREDTAALLIELCHQQENCDLGEDAQTADNR